MFPEEQNSRELHFNLACAYSTLADHCSRMGKNEEAESSLLESAAQYGICVEFGPDSESLNNWGLVLASFAKLKNKPESLELQKEVNLKEFTCRDSFFFCCLSKENTFQNSKPHFVGADKTSTSLRNGSKGFRGSSELCGRILVR